MCPEPIPEAGVPGETDSMDELLDQAVRGDARALDVFFSLLKTRYGTRVLGKLRRERGNAHTATLEDVMQQSLFQFMAEIRGGALPELHQGEVLNILAYFQKLCARNLAAHRQSSYSLRARGMSELHEDISRDARLDRSEPAPGELPDQDDRAAGHKALMNAQFARFSAFDRSVMEDHMLGTPYAEISRRTGKSSLALRALVCRLKDRLIRNITEVSPTARLAQESAGRAAKDPEVPSECPSASEIMRALRRLHKDIQEAVDFVHLGGGTPEDFALRLGERGLEKAQARLRSAYESLTLELDLPFPESFSLLGEAPDV